jgi:hypothetical protein
MSTTPLITIRELLERNPLTWWVEDNRKNTDGVGPIVMPAEGQQPEAMFLNVLKPEPILTEVPIQLSPHRKADVCMPTPVSGISKPTSWTWERPHE